MTPCLVRPQEGSFAKYPAQSIQIGQHRTRNQTKRQFGARIQHGGSCDQSDAGMGDDVHQVNIAVRNGSFVASAASSMKYEPTPNAIRPAVRTMSLTL